MDNKFWSRVGRARVLLSELSEVQRNQIYQHEHVWWTAAQCRGLMGIKSRTYTHQILSELLASNVLMCRKGTSQRGAMRWEYAINTYDAWLPPFDEVQNG